MTKILVVGCSMTYGEGLDSNIHDPKLWVNQLLKQAIPTAEIDNLSYVGKNNHWIFTETASALIRKYYDIVVVGWSAMLRYNFQVGLETYPTDTMLKNVDVNINPGVKIPGKWLERLGNDLKKLHNYHWNILDLIKYVNILYDLQVVARKGKLFFVNTMFTIPDTYFNYIDFSTPSELDSYTQDLLNVETRDDSEIKQIYNMIHEQYNLYGGIKSEHWLNLYNSFMSMKIDDADKDGHPGYKSQDLFANYLLPILKEKL